MSDGFSSFREFYPYYLGEHRDDGGPRRVVVTLAGRLM